MLHITSLMCYKYKYKILCYLITGSSYPLTTFIQPSLPPPSVLSNLQSDLLFYEVVCYWSIIDLQHCFSSCSTTWWFSISVHFKVSTRISSATVCHLTETLHSYWLYSPHCAFYAQDSFILYVLICLTYFLLQSPSSLAMACLFSVSVSVSLCLFMCF